MADLECEVCGGDGRYPIINTHGTEIYSITCPECFGLGVMESAAYEAEPADMPPVSSAASIKTMDQLREFVAANWSGQDGTP